MDPQRTDILRGAFGMTSTAAAAPAEVKSAKSGQDDLYDTQYKKWIAKGMSPKQAAAFAKQYVKRAKGY